MPPLRPVQGVARLAFLSRANNVAVVNVLHVSNGLMPQPYTPATLQTLVTNIKPLWSALWKPSVASSASWELLTATDLTSETAPQIIDNITGEIGTGGTATTVPQSAAAVITWKIPRHYRGGHPRTYMGPLFSGAITNPTTLASTYTDPLQTRANTFLAAVNAIVLGTATARLVCLHRQKDGVILDVPTTTLIDTAYCDSRIDSQRRRLGKDR